MRYTIEEAQARFEELLRRVSAGEDVIITRDGNDIVRLTAVARRKAPAAKRIPGKFAGQFSCTDDAFDPLTDQEMKDLGFE
jgi:prevent-host-death family protein